MNEIGLILFTDVNKKRKGKLAMTNSIRRGNLNHVEMAEIFW